jgi:cellulose synthase/poly-beta-1,6-N-acetylglucosamine synthase-like glycosyltransferase
MSPLDSWASAASVRAALSVLNGLMLCGLLLYAANAYVMVAVHWRHRRDRPAPPDPPAPLPMVTVQLPLFNERYVAARLLEAAASLDYPADRLEIQVLDDSTDDTTAIVAEVAGALTARGLTVVHIHRRERSGFKAGALAAGLKEARGEFIAIFDADFVPSPDFLRATLPHFADATVAVVQARWGHLNRDFSLLTVAQSLGIDGHFGVEQTARARGGLLLNFNGTAGVWRKAAILDAGGWADDTLTEDLDLSYRAQLRSWRIVYRPEIVCPAEIPVLITGFKTQQRRWAKGSIQTARKLLPAVWRSPVSPWRKYQASIHLTYYMIHPLMLLSMLLSIPLRSTADPQISSAWGIMGGVFAVATLGPGTMLVYAQHALDTAWWRRARQLPTILVIGVGMAWTTSLAVLGAFAARDLTFVRTPKFGIGPRGGRWRGKVYRDGRPWGGLVEIALGLYFGWGAWVFWLHREYGVVPFLLLYASGFVTVGTLTILHAAGGARTAARGAP